MIYVPKDAFLKHYNFQDEFSYDLFKHFFYCEVEEDEIDEWIWNPFDFQPQPQDFEPDFCLSFPDNHYFDKNEITYEDAITFDRLNKTYGRDVKINSLLK